MRDQLSICLLQLHGLSDELVDEQIRCLEGRFVKCTSASDRSWMEEILRVLIDTFLGVCSDGDCAGEPVSSSFTTSSEPTVDAEG